MSDDIEFPLLILPEGRNLETGRKQQAYRALDQPEDLAAAIVSEDVNALQIRNRRSPIDVSSYDRTARRPGRIFGHRRDQAVCRTAGARQEAVIALHDAPSIVASKPNEIDLLPIILSDVGSPEFAGLPVEGKAPGIPQAVSENLRSSSAGREGIVRWDGVRGATVHIDSQNLSEQLLLVLATVSRIAGGSSVAPRNIEKSVRTKRHHPPVMVGERLRNCHEQVFFSPRPVGVLGHLVFGQDCRAVGCPVIVHDIAAVLPKGRVKGEAEQPLLSSSPHATGDVQKRHLKQLAVLDHSNPVWLLNHKQSVTSVSCLSEKQRVPKPGL